MSGLRQLRKIVGFTLVEMVMVIIILGILVLGVSSFVILGTRIFVESTSVDQVLSQSRFAIERMTREFRNAVPNSLRVTNTATVQCIEFVPIQSSASYIDLPIAPEAASETGSIITPSLVINKDHRMLVYPLTPAHIYSAAADATEGRLLDIFNAEVKDKDKYTTVTFDRKVRFSEASPRNRFFMVNNAVSYCFFTNGDVRRYEGYDMFNTAQPTPGGKINTLGDVEDGVLMAENVVIGTGGWPISYTPGSLTNNAVVQLSPKFMVNGQEFQYQHQVQVVNVP